MQTQVSRMARGFSLRPLAPLAGSALACSALAGSALAGSVLAAPALALDGGAGNHRADLRFGPLIGGQDLVLNVDAPQGSPVALFLGLAKAPSIPADPSLPIVSVAPSSSFVLLPTNPAGKLQLRLPTFPGQFAALSGLRLHAQTLVSLADGTLATSSVQSARLAASAPPADFLVEQSAAQLPAGFDSLGAFSAEAGDLDRDGDEDLILAKDADLVVWINDGSGQFSDESATRLVHPGGFVNCIELGDVDNDQDLDLIVCGGVDDQVDEPDRLWLNDGSGVFSLAPFPAGVGDSSDFELGDVDGDGDLDAVVAFGTGNHAGGVGAPDQLYRNQGKGLFVPDAAFAGGSWNDPQFPTGAYRMGDVDGDGDLDLFQVLADFQGLVGLVGEPNRLLLNDGAGQFTDVSAAQLPSGLDDNSEDATLVDLDGDGDLDIVVANSLLSVPSAFSGDLLINQGGAQGGFPGHYADDASTELELFDGMSGIRLGALATDVDGDGDQDVLIAVHDFFPSGADQRLLLNQGGAQQGTEGELLLADWFDPGDGIVFDPVFFDADGDGDQDLLLPGGGVLGGDPLQANRARLLINQLP